MKSKNGVDINFTKDFEVELVGDFSSDLSSNLEMMLRSKNSFTVDEFLEAIIIGYECGITHKSLMVYLENLDFDISVSERIKKELTDFINNEGEFFNCPDSEELT